MTKNQEIIMNGDSPDLFPIFSLGLHLCMSTLTDTWQLHEYLELNSGQPPTG